MKNKNRDIKLSNTIRVRKSQNQQYKKWFINSIFLFGIIFFINIIFAENLTIENDLINGSEVSICERQLNRTIEVYNSLLKDFRDGTNCGDAAVTLKYMNEILSEERNECREEIGELKVYKIGFYFLSILLVMIAIVRIYRVIREK